MTGVAVLNETEAGAPNHYAPGFQLLKKMCDEDYDWVVLTSFGYMAQGRDVSGSYAPCKKAADGGAHKTYFSHVGGYLTNDLMSTIFGKIYQMGRFHILASGLKIGHSLENHFKCLFVTEERHSLLVGSE